MKKLSSSPKNPKAPRSKSSAVPSSSFRPAAPRSAARSASNAGPYSSTRGFSRDEDRGEESSASRPSGRRGGNTASYFAPRAESRATANSADRSFESSSGRSAATGSASRGPSSARPASSARAAQSAPRSSAKPAPRPSILAGFHGAVIDRRAADRLREGHLWVYATSILELEAPKGEAPRLLPVADNRGMFLATALYSPASQIPLRIVSREQIDEAAWLVLFEERLRRAVVRRKSLLSKETDSCRLVFSEADELPGLMIDKYADLAVVQLLVRSLDSDEIRKIVVKVLRDELAPKAIWERPDPKMRELEGLSAPSTEALYAKSAKSPLAATDFHLNGLTFHYDANSGQKTGAFLDQRLNYAAAAEWAEKLGLAGGRALDICTYQGGFALHLAKIAGTVTGVDQSLASLEVAEENLAANKKQIKAEVDWVHGDAFELLRNWSDAGEKFDVIVLDPPAFAKSKRAVEGALRGYKELNLRALKMLKPGGLLVSCSCSHHVSGLDLESMVAAAATDAHRRVRLLERRGAATDHPVVFNLPETEYLKCLLMEVD